MRAGKPWVTGSGCPFMPTAISAFRPSRIACSGVEIVMPSVPVDSTWSAPALIPARRSRPASGTPSQRAFPA